MKKLPYEQRPDEWMSRLTPFIDERRRDKVRFRPETSALIVTDMQRYFVDAGSHARVPAADGIVGNLQMLVGGYRGKRLPIVFTRHALARGEDPGAMGRWWADSLYDDDPLAEIVPGLQPLKGDRVIRKTQYSAFEGTGLDQFLTREGVEQLVITGLVTHLCCESTARDAFMRDYDVFFVIDGTASKSEELHLSSLMAVAEGFGTPVTTKEVLLWLER